MCTNIAQVRKLAILEDYQSDHYIEEHRRCFIPLPGDYIDSSLRYPCKTHSLRERVQASGIEPAFLLHFYYVLLSYVGNHCLVPDIYTGYSNIPTL